MRLFDLISELAQQPNRRSGVPQSLSRAAVAAGTIAPALFLVAVAMASVAYFVRALSPIVGLLDRYFPLEPGDASPSLAILSAVGLSALAAGLLRGKTVAWWLAVGTLAVTVVGQMGALQHPLGFVIGVGLLAVLVADRRRYEVESNAGWRLVIVASIIVGALMLALETSIVVAGTGQWPRPLGILGDLTSALGNALGISDDLGNAVLKVTSHNALLALLLVAARLPFVLAAVGVLSREPEPPPDLSTRIRSRDIAGRFGSGALLPFQLGDDKLVFSPPSESGVVVYGLSMGTAVVLGDPIGPAPVAREVFEEFLARCHRMDRLPVVYQASQSGRSLLLEHGFRLFKVGEEAIVDLTSFDLAGSRRANLRHTITRCRKAGVTVGWYGDGLATASRLHLLDELEAIDAEWQKRAGPRMGFTISSFDREVLESQPVAVAVDEGGHALGFATFRPTGADGGWVLDLIRRAPGSPPGVVEACIAEAALGLKNEGAPSLSLGLAPLAGLSAAGSFEERLLAVAARLVSRWYDIRGLAFFKSKFDPQWVPRYGAVRHRRDLIAFAVGLLALHVRPSFGSRAAAASRTVTAP